MGMCESARSAILGGFAITKTTEYWYCAKGKPGTWKCQWSSSKKQKKRRSGKGMSKETIVSLSKSDKGSYFQNWNTSSNSEVDEHRPVGASRRKLETSQESGHLETWDFESESRDIESDSSDESDTKEASHSLNTVDGQLL